MTSKPMEELAPSSPSPPPLYLEDDRAGLQSPSANQDKKAKEEEEEEEEGNEEVCRTPTSNESKLSFVPLTCPPAPKKARSHNSGCRRRLSEFDFLEVSSEELEKLFNYRRSGEKVSLSSKKRKWSSF